MLGRAAAVQLYGTLLHSLSAHVWNEVRELPGLTYLPEQYLLKTKIQLMHVKALCK